MKMVIHLHGLTVVFFFTPLNFIFILLNNLIVCFTDLRSTNRKYKILMDFYFNFFFLFYFILFILFQRWVPGVQPLCADNFPDDFDYADVDFQTYGPINYKAASIYALVKKNKNGNLNEIRK